MKKFGTFEGVFLPALLTIIGVMMFLRLGWIVGNIGFSGTVLIIILAHITTITTALAVSSISTNTKMGEGGVYYILSRSLGYEIGGAVGISLYCAQVFGCALYVLGFTEVWILLFPDHNPKVVASAAFFVLFIVSYISSNLTLKIQYFIFAVIMLSILDFFWGVFPEFKESTFHLDFNIHNINHQFWYFFAIFFPAVTGLESGISMSGDLKNPKKSMPVGTIGAVSVGFIIYIFVAYLYSLETNTELLKSSTYIASKAVWKPLVIVGILLATLSSAIGTILAAPRILVAMAKDNVIPFRNFFIKKNKKGEPTSALIFSAVVMYASMNLGDLNKIAGLLTMFFLISYATLNVGLLIEKVVDSPSFRPYFKIPIIIPIVGCLWSIVVALLINAVFAFIAIVLSVCIYFIIMKKHLHNESGDVRYSFFNMLGEWAIKMTDKYPAGKKNWKPNFLVAVDKPKFYTEKTIFLRDLAFPNGSIRMFSVFVNSNLKTSNSDFFNRGTQFLNNLIRETDDELKKKQLIIEKGLSELIEPFRKENIYSSYQIIEAKEFYDTFNVTAQIMKGLPFPPNILYLTVSEDEKKDERLKNIIQIGINNHLGILTLYVHPIYKMGSRKKINVWLRYRSPNIHLIILISNILAKNWGAKISLITVLDDESEREMCDKFLNKIIDAGRMIRSTEKCLYVGGFMDRIKNSSADLHIFGSITDDVDIIPIRSVINIINNSCIFLKDSGMESAMV